MFQSTDSGIEKHDNMPIVCFRIENGISNRVTQRSSLTVEVVVQELEQLVVLLGQVGEVDEKPAKIKHENSRYTERDDEMEDIICFSWLFGQLCKSIVPILSDRSDVLLLHLSALILVSKYDRRH